MSSLLSCVAGDGAGGTGGAGGGVGGAGGGAGGARGHDVDVNAVYATHGLNCEADTAVNIVGLTEV